MAPDFLLRLQDYQRDGSLSTMAFLGVVPDPSERENGDELRGLSAVASTPVAALRWPAPKHKPGGSRMVEPDAAVVLVVDDDPDVLNTATMILQHAGMTVVTAPDAGTALDRLREADHIDLLFTDIVMPGMDGFALAHEAKRIRPELKVVYTSGYIRDVPWGQSGVGYGPLLAKPWGPQAARDTIASVLRSE